MKYILDEKHLDISKNQACLYVNSPHVKLCFTCCITCEKKFEVI